MKIIENFKIGNNNEKKARIGQNGKIHKLNKADCSAKVKLHSHTAKHGEKNNITLTAETHGFPLPAKTGERTFPSTVWDSRSITSEAHNRSGTESTWNFGSPDPGVGFDGRWGRNWETKTPSTLCFEMT
ncbi:hypothetical protein CEXT_36711 [Caerostris extrusa]|uniref:Uncharacterized protein n=1 Tax=Caerostris extrusa TaxID=172846 RepID=A0AAV4WVE6_CAEEX|nr:hypothetical protein CEXT_36711 [Caerostris extrusa]